MKRAFFCLTVLALPFGCADTVSAALIASLRGDYQDGVNQGDLANNIDAAGSGTWAYLASDTPNPSNDGDLTTMYWDTAGAGGSWLGNPVGAPQTYAHHVALEADEIYTHPYWNLPGYSVARWTAGVGEAGPTSIVGNVRDLDLGGGDGVTFEIFVNGTSVFDQVVVNTSEGQSFDIRTTVDVGSIVDFVVGDNVGSDFDSTALSATVSSVPEPSTLIMLVGAGAALLAFARRRKQKAAS